MASDGVRKQFWKRSNSKVPGSIQHVYGAQHPPFDPLLHGTLLKSSPKVPTTPVKAKRVSTFQEFESNTSDAWDAGEDDDELLAMATESLNSEVVMETAHRVLRNHSQRQSQPAQKEMPEPEPQPIAEPPVAPSGDLRLVKSVSESHTPCPSESTSDSVPLQRSQSLPHSATVSLSGTSDPHALGSSALSKREASRLDKFNQLLAGPNTDLEELRKLSWSGIPKPVRPMTWKLLSGYLPANVDRRPATLQRKQKEYFAFIEHYYNSRNDEVHQDTYRQLGKVSCDGSNSISSLIPYETAFRSTLGLLQRRKSGPAPRVPYQEDVDEVDVSSVPEEVLRNIEADTYWCMSKLLDGIQGQPIITSYGPDCLPATAAWLKRVHRHLDGHEVQYLQFAFRWMNNLLMRELPLRCTIRLWDTYQSEPEGFSHFHLYVCAAFLVRWRREILEERDFQELLLFLQNLPTARWDDQDVSLLLAEAYRLKFAFADAPNHYKK
ncbi:TBC1 domain family member 22A [Onychomys torridus]|uniref:TBC1 domain family member 22A n=1 Tax=Onychomys torridus TaxID=38674 RepID=UPI00167FB266|nr:TBC1 domain family member 22A [Onychomys torridus]